MSASTDEPAPGRYRHYKGSFYSVLGLATHSETGEILVVYRPEYGAGKLWVRPRAMFLESVSLDGKSVPRFMPVDPSTKIVPPDEGPLEQVSDPASK